MNLSCQRAIILIFISLLCLWKTSLLAETPRVVVLGFDGADPKLVSEGIKDGLLPNLKQLKTQGSFLPLETTNPAQSPVAWASFSTGTNPGKHRVFGFLKRGEKNYQPQFALIKVDRKKIWGGSKGRLLISFVIGTIFFLSLFLIGKKLAYSPIYHYSSGVISILIFCFCSYCLLSYIPEEMPSPTAFKTGDSFWTTAAQAGIRTKVLFAPIAFPAEKLSNGKLLCGFGVPDLCATNGTWFFCSTRFSNPSSNETGGWNIPIEKKKQTHFKAEFPGPKNFLRQEEYQKLQNLLPNTDFKSGKSIRNRLAIVKKELYMKGVLSIERSSSDTITLTVDQQTISLKERDWSPWLTISFQMSPFITLKGIFRCCLQELGEHIDLYLTPVQFHPSHSLAPISYPESFSDNLAKENGLFPTLGWASATNALKDELLEEDVFEQDLENVIQAREKIIFSSLEKDDWDLFSATFYFPDRISHMYWRFLDPKNPRHAEDVKKHPQKRQTISKFYQRMDKIIGQVQKKLRPTDILLIVSDHGFAPFRWQVNLNTWLHQEGFLTLEKQEKSRRMQVRDLFESKNLLRFDWSKTQAYSIGLGKIFINLKGRDPQGIVAPEDYERVCQEIQAKLLNLHHQGEPVVKRVYRREEIFSGPYVKETADLFLGFHKGYRVSWQTSLGGLSSEAIEANKLKWSGDHCSVDPSLVPGIFLCNYPISKSTLHIQDIASGILHIFALEGDNLDGKIFEIAK